MYEISFIRAEDDTFIYRCEKIKVTAKVDTLMTRITEDENTAGVIKKGVWG